MFRTATEGANRRWDRGKQEEDDGVLDGWLSKSEDQGGQDD